MEDLLYDEIVEYLGTDKPSDMNERNALEISIRRAISSFKTKRSYPVSFSEEQVETDMMRCKYCIFDLSLYYYFKMGNEYESLHIENTVHRTYSSENSIYQTHGIYPYACFI